MHPGISAFSGPEFGPLTEPVLTRDTRRRPAPIRYPDFSDTGPNLSGFPHRRPDLTHPVGPGFTWRPAGLLTALDTANKAGSADNPVHQSHENYTPDEEYFLRLGCRFDDGMRYEHWKTVAHVQTGRRAVKPG
jgi:hypothetical protein